LEVRRPLPVTLNSISKITDDLVTLFPTSFERGWNIDSLSPEDEGCPIEWFNAISMLVESDSTMDNGNVSQVESKFYSTLLCYILHVALIG
jgi:hypothetical protein